KRRVRVGYVVENPMWKTSYRLVLPSGKKQEAPYLQGWAVVENPSDEDWNSVRMALVSGRPISFKMDLYTPLFVPRPTVVPELFASLNPVAYSGSMEDDQRRLADLNAARQLEEKRKRQLLALRSSGPGAPRQADLSNTDLGLDPKVQL